MTSKAEVHMRLKPGQQAPDLDTTDISGNPVSLQALRGKTVLLSFYRYASCPFCNLRVHTLAERYPQWQAAGLEILAIFQSPTDSIAKYVGKQKSPFPIISDPDHIFYRAFGTESSVAGFLKVAVSRPGDLLKASKLGYNPGKMEGTKTQLPADFLIGPNGQVLASYYGQDIGDHLPIETIETHLTSS
jgi:thioredoxin-dependent peroxiredoxin